MDKLTNAHGKARGCVTDPPVKALKDALNMLSMSVRDAQQQGSRVEDEDIREMLANLDIKPRRGCQRGSHGCDSGVGNGGG